MISTKCPKCGAPINERQNTTRSLGWITWRCGSHRETEDSPFVQCPECRIRELEARVAELESAARMAAECAIAMDEQSTERKLRELVKLYGKHFRRPAVTPSRDFGEEDALNRIRELKTELGIE